VIDIWNLRKLDMKDIPAPVDQTTADLEHYIGEFIAAALELRSARVATHKAAKAQIVNEVYHRLSLLLADLRREHG
jgi:hypothetical protein